jgi:hypothetical protein
MLRDLPPAAVGQGDFRQEITPGRNRVSIERNSYVAVDLIGRRWFKYPFTNREYRIGVSVLVLGKRILTGSKAANILYYQEFFD